jgi:NADH-quinone oxidoreductase subunit H
MERLFRWYFRRNSIVSHDLWNPMESLISSIDIQYVIGSLVKIAVFWIFIMLVVAYMVYAERRVLAVIQNRLGPNRVGWQGLLQPFADLIKFIFKEDIIPLAVNKALYVAAPVIVLIPAMMVLIVYPFGPEVPLPFGAEISTALNDLGSRLGFNWDINLTTINLYITNFNVGLLYVFALTSLGIYGIVIGGWASNSKYSLLGGLRSSAQMISYELALSLSVVAVLIQAGTLDLVKIVEGQSGWFGFKWNIFMLFPAGLIAFTVYLVSAIAETNRVPFDLPEAETELVAGFHTEYSSLKFALFFMAEYVNMTTVSVLATTLFLGGWQGPGVGQFPWLGPVYFLAKVFFFLFLYIWLRGTLPRLRYDQLMNFGWKVLLPTALFNIILASVLGVLFL